MQVTEILTAGKMLNCTAGADVSIMRLLEEGISLGHSNFALRRAISIMNQRTELTEFNRGQRFRRLR